MDGVDLNGPQAQSLRNFLRRRPHVHRQDVVRAAHGFCAVDNVREDCGAVQRRLSGANAVLRRTIPSHGVRSTDLSREPARYRNLPVGPGVETLSPGFPRTGAALDAGRCQRDARLAHSCRARPTSDRPSQQAVRRRKPGFAPDDTVYALDSATIDRLSVFPWAHFRSTKAAVKMHTLLDLRGNIPSFIHVSDGKLHDVHALDMLLPEPGAIYVMDRGYVDFTRLHVLHEAGAFFVTRAKSNMDAHRVYSAPTDRTTGIISDQTIAMDGYLTRQHYPAHLRRIRFKDPETGKTLIFLTNQMTLPALTVCALYKSRWQVELFFDDFPYCTPSYAIEKTESVDWDYTIAELLGEETLSEAWQRQPSEAPKEHSNRPELPADALAGSYATPLNL